MSIKNFKAKIDSLFTFLLSTFFVWTIIFCQKKKGETFIVMLISESFFLKFESADYFKKRIKNTQINKCLSLCRD